MIIDAHTHVWPDVIARRAIGGRDHGLDAVGDGTVAGLGAHMEVSGVDRSVIFGIGEKPATLEKANAFVGAQDRSRFIPFGSIHVELSPEENLDILHRHRIQGIKVHPLFQGFALTDPRLIAILQAVGSELPVLAHVGAGGSDQANARCTPEMIVELARAVPDVNIIAAHFGGFRQLDVVERLLPGAPLFLETSWPPRLGDLPVDRVRAVVERHGPDRVIFGTDWPMADQRTEIEAVRALGLSEAEERAILGGNLARLLGLDVAAGA